MRLLQMYSISGDIHKSTNSCTDLVKEFPKTDKNQRSRPPSSFTQQSTAIVQAFSLNNMQFDLVRHAVISARRTEPPAGATVTLAAPTAGLLLNYRFAAALLSLWSSSRVSLTLLAPHYHYSRGTSWLTK